ncbi:MAG: acyl-CoA dehydratase activase [Eubacteriales bacterium]|nr:acyl-CoA dehydratase activase [Eubacteriales bacterium]
MGEGYQLGMDLGSSALKVCLCQRGKILFLKKSIHHGGWKKEARRLLKELAGRYPQMERVKAAVSGSNASELAALLGKEYLVQDIPAITRGSVEYQAGSLMEIGSQNARFITDIQKGKTPRFAVNEQCAGGTGSFFESQMARLGMTINDISQLVLKAESAPALSGRCAVFAKTDIIHKQQEGYQTPDILLGLCYAMVRNYKAVIVRKLPVYKPVLLCGGIAANLGVIRAMREVFALSQEELLIPQNHDFIQAIGTARLGEREIQVAQILRCLDDTLRVRREERKTCLGSRAWDECRCGDPGKTGRLSGKACFLGIDIGSTSTNVLLMEEGNVIVDYWYLRTLGDSMGAVQRAFAEIRKGYGDIRPSAVGITGSGRERIGRMLGCDVVVDEITCQAKGAAAGCPEADTIFEIGGQDSKFIAVERGEVRDFRMNKICSAGTGTLAEEQANALGISIGEFGELALDGENPTALSERCTVFIETAVKNALSRGETKENICAGICEAIVSNYLHKVAAEDRIGNHIVLQGGVAYNPGIVRAFQKRFQGRIRVNPLFPVSGAMGAAIMAMEAGVSSSRFRGFLPLQGRPADRDEELSPETQRRIQAYKQAQAELFAGYEERINPEKETVGIPLVLVLHKFFPMARAYFSSLGYNVVCSGYTTPEILELAQRYAQGEVCFPVKLMYGHMMYLAEKKVDYIFMPSIHTMRHVNSGVEHNYGCMYMQSAARIVAENLELERMGIRLLDPVFDMDFGAPAMVKSMIELGVRLGHPAPKAMFVMTKAAKALMSYTKGQEKMGRELLASLGDCKKAVVLISRPYNLSDPRLHMGIAEMLMKRGMPVLTIENLPADDTDISQEYPNFYWPFSQHILTAAKQVRHHPNLYAVYLMNHGCGPDSVLSHAFRREMGDKPYLAVEIDEQTSAVGVVTRIEAFLRSVHGRPTCRLEKGFDLKAVTVKPYPVTTLREIAGERVYFPALGKYTEAIARYLRETYSLEGIPCDITDRETIRIGRSLTSSKEYITFTAMLGMAVGLARQAKEKGAHRYFLLSENQGAEADGVFARVIGSVLEEQGLDPYLTILSPMLERAFGIAGYFSEVDRGFSSKGRILVVGEPLCVHAFGKPYMELIRRAGMEYELMPLSSYLDFLWGRETEETKRCAGLADKRVPVFDGGNGRFRCGFAEAAEDARGVLLLSPLYENTGLILELAGIGGKAPLLHLAIDGNVDEGSRNRLETFLYYL